MSMHTVERASGAPLILCVPHTMRLGRAKSVGEGGAAVVQPERAGAARGAAASVVQGAGCGAGIIISARACLVTLLPAALDLQRTCMPSDVQPSMWAMRVRFG